MSNRLLVVPFLLAAACAAGGAPVDDDEAFFAADGKADGASTTTYRDLEEVLTGDDFERWFDLKRVLAREFDEVCGDTFCEGDYTNLQPLRLRCSVAVSTGALRSCIWLFAGSWETVRPATGSIEVHAKVFRCRLPFSGAPSALLDALLGPGSAEGPLRRPIPGSGGSIYDALGDCFE
jgi:hypothetical protein